MLAFDDPQISLMLDEVSNLISTLENTLDITVKMKRKYRNIGMFGMGGSSIGSEVVLGILSAIPDVRLLEITSPTLPGWVDKDTLVIVSTYSGNTIESIMMYEQAVLRGVDTVVITSGGELLTSAEQNGSYVIKVPTGMQPRSCIGCFVGILLNIVKANGWYDATSSVREAIPFVKEYYTKITEDSKLILEIASAVHTSVPVIYSNPDYFAVANRWRNQFTENSEILAFSGVIPEFNHNQIVAWCNKNHKHGLLPIILKESTMTPVMSKIIDSSVEILRSYGCNPLVVDIEGSTNIECILKGILLGDLISLQLAYLGSVDPLNIAPINDLKALFKEKIDSESIEQSLHPEVLNAINTNLKMK